MVNMVEKEEIHKQGPGIKRENTNLISFNSNHSMIKARLKTLSKQATMMIPYKIHMGCNGNIMPFNIFKKLFPSTKDTLAAMKDMAMLRAYNSTTITQLGRCSVVIKMSVSRKIHIFVVPGDGDMLLSMQDIELLNILQISCNTISTNKEEKGMNYNKIKKNAINAKVSSAVQTQAWKRIVIKRTMMQTPVQTQATV